MPTTPTNTFSAQCLLPAIAPQLALEKPIRLAPNGTYPAGAVLGEQVGTNERVRLTFSGLGDATGGNFVLIYDSATTGNIAIWSSAAQIQAALEAMSSVGAGNIKVEGGWNAKGGIFNLEFRGELGGTNAGAVTCTTTGITASAPAFAASVITSGATGTKGQFITFDAAGVDGRERAVAINKYACTTDASGNITGPGGEHGETTKSIPAYVAGYFNTADLNGLTEVAAAHLGKLVSGTIGSGLLLMS